MKAVETSSNDREVEGSNYAQRGLAAILPMIIIAVGGIFAIYAIVAVENADVTIQSASFLEAHRKVVYFVIGAAIASLGIYFMPNAREARAKRRREKTIAKQRRAADKAARGR